MTHVEGGGVPAGTQLNGIYEIEQRIAMGGMGEVYIGHVVQTGDKVAIKMILPEHANNDLILDLFRKEASTLHNLYHEAIVRYYVFSVDPALNRPYLAMEYAEGPALGDRVRQQPLSEAEMAVMLPRVAGGLHAAHKAGIVHRDLSPDNIILIGGDVNRAKIIDFGIAKSSNSEGTLIGSGFAGKLKYVSPEQLGLGNGDVTAKSDIYSLGLVLAEAAIGHPLDMGGTQVEVIEKRRSVPDLSAVPAFVRPLIEWMLQPDPANRPASMEAVAAWKPSGPAPAAEPTWSEATQIAPGGFVASQYNQGSQPPTYPPTQPPAYQAPSQPPQQAPYYPDQQAVSQPPPQQAAAPGAVPHPRDRARNDEAPRRRGGALRILSILFTGVLVAGGVGAFLMMKEPDDGPKGGGTGGQTAGTGGGTGSQTAGGTTDGGTAGTGTTGGTETAGAGETAGTDGKDGGATAGTTDGGTQGSGETTTADATDTGGSTDPGRPELPTLPGGDRATSDTSGVKLPGSGSDGVATDTTPGRLTGEGTTSDTLGKAESTATEGGDADATDGGASVPGAGDGTTPALAGGDATGGTEGGGTTDGTAAATDTGDLKEPSVPTSIPGEIKTGGVGSDSAGVATTEGSGDSVWRPGADSPSGLAGSGGGAGLVPVLPNSDGTSVPKPGEIGDATALVTPGGADSSGISVPKAGETGSPGVSDAAAPMLPGGDRISDNSLSTTPVAADERDPADSLKEPEVSTALPGGLSAPAGGESGLPVAGDGGDDLPMTGSATSAPASPGTPVGGGDAYAAIKPPENLPPTISERAPDTLSASQGKPLDVRLGTFFDEDGASNLELKIQGDVPTGLNIRMVSGGVVEMAGIPSEYGDYTIKVAAIDSKGLLSESITVALSVERPLENRDVSDYILGYDGGECFHSRPVQLGPQLARIEVFASEAHIPQVLAFDSDFKRDQGFEANIIMRPISPEQCAIVRVLDLVGPGALDNSIVIKMINDTLVPGDELAGKIVGGRDARLFLYDDLAGITDLSRFIREAGGEFGFNLRIRSGSGPQILIAARPRDGSGLPPDASLNELLEAAQQGRASLALGFFVLKSP